MFQQGFGKIVVAALIFGACPPAVHAQAGGRGKSVQQLEKELAARDAVISNLQRRVEAVEEKLRAAASPATPAPAVPEPPAAKTDKPADEAVDDELLARALERSLVLSGGVLLPRGQLEIEPSLQYDYSRRSGLGIVEAATIANQDVRRDNYLASLGLRAGLPWASQLEVTVPFGYQKIDSVEADVGSSASDTGIGDIQIGASKQLLIEKNGRPGLIANLAWQFSTGDSNLATLVNPAADPSAPVTSLSAGYEVLSATLTAVKRLDPLVFLGSLSHSFNRSTDAGGVNIDPGDTNSGSFQAILAASPTVSLRTGFSLARTGNTRLNGSTVLSSRQTIGVLEFGVSAVLARRSLLDVTIGAGLTEDAPDFVLGVSLPVRF